jgi:hypothetical protein
MSSRLLFVALLFAGGCVGGITDGGGDDQTTDDGNPPPPPPGTTAREMFDDDVFPILNAKCKACHGQVGFLSTPFVADSAALGYDTVVGYDSVVGTFTDAAPILTKVTVGPHQGGGVAYGGTEQNKIVAWLAQEVAERQIGGGGDPPPGTETPGASTTRLVNQFAGCLTLDDFTGVNFGPRLANKGSNQGQCQQCHWSGAYGYFVNDDNATVYDVLTTNKYYLLAYYAADVTPPLPADRKMMPNFMNYDRVCRRVPPHTEHPQCQAPDPGPPMGPGNDDAYQALVELYDIVQARILAGTCGPPIPL